MPAIDCETFVRLIPHFEDQPKRGPSAGVDYDTWCNHMHACATCSDALLAYRLRAWDVDPCAFPCVHMAYRATQTCPMHEERAECPDLFISYDEVFDEYSLIKDGVSLVISFCPWCGTHLPPSQRERWFQELEQLLGTNPLAAAGRVPKRYRSREWRG
jgi:hypothetical protein